MHRSVRRQRAVHRQLQRRAWPVCGQMHPIVFVALLVLSPAVAAGNFAICILDSMPGLQNDSAAYAATQVCAARYPGGLNSVPQGEGRGWFGYDSGAECAAKKAANTPSRVAGQRIFGACKRLYDEPPWTLFDDLIPPKQ